MNDLANIDNMAVNKSEKIFSVTRLDSKIDLLAPQYIVYGNSYFNKTNQRTDLIIQISDLGLDKLSAKLGIID